MSFVLLLSLLVTKPCYAQLEYSNWVWADSNHLQFDFDTVSIENSSHIYSYADGSRAVASISDRNGNLLFSASTKKAVDKNGDTLSGYNFPNGGTYAATICPMPCNDSLYYVFRSKGGSGIDTIQYYVVNVNGNGGNGSIANGALALDYDFSGILYDLEITRHSNNRDYWLVLFSRDGDEFHSWLISDTGIASSPIISSVGNSQLGVEIAGFARFSPNGEYFATSSIRYINGAGINTSYLNLFQFDNTTGMVSLFCELDKSSLAYPAYSYSVCFSPDGSKLYATSSMRALWQFDLSSGDSATIASSGQNIVSYSTSQPYALREMQLGLDGRIYITRFYGVIPHNEYLAIINNPNDTGSACNFVLNGLDCNQYTYLGLPSIIHNLYVKREIVSDSANCTLDTTTLTFDNYAYFDSAEWFVDTGQSQFSVTSDTSVQVIFDSGGIYPIMAVSYSGCRLDTFYDTILVIPSPEPDLGPDTILCEGDTIEISNEWFYTYLWSTGDTTESIQILEPDTFWLELSNYCGTARDTVIIDSIIQALVDFELDDTLLCDGETVLLDASVDQGTYLWYDGSTNSTFSTSFSDTIWCKATNVCGSDSDSVVVVYTDIPELPNLNDTLCVDDTLFVDLTTDSLSQFLWANGSVSPFDTITTNTIFWIEETNICGEDRDTFQVHFVTDPEIELGNDTIICVIDSILLEAFSPFSTYVWSNGSHDSAITVDGTLFVGQDSLKLHVSVTNACTSIYDSILVIADDSVVVELGPEQTLCLGDTVMLQNMFFIDTGRTSLTWSTGSSGESIHAIPSKNVLYYLTAENACGLFSDSINVYVDEPITPNLGDDFHACFFDSILLTPGYFERSQYEWKSIPNRFTANPTTASLELTAGSLALPLDEKTIFVSTVSNTCGSVSDTVILWVDSLPTTNDFDSLFFCRDQGIAVVISKDDIDYLEWEDGSRDTSRFVDRPALWNVTYFNHCGQSEDIIPVGRKEPPTIEIESPQLLCDKSLLLYPEVVLQPGELYGAQTFLWDDSTDQQNRWVDSVGSYSLIVTNQWNCKDSVVVEVKTCGADFYIPNAFTPSNDDLNNYWKPVGEGLSNYHITIYDRWGRIVYEFNEASIGWDGTNQEKKAPTGTYYWKMTVNSEEFRNNFFEGLVVLIR